MTTGIWVGNESGTGNGSVNDKNAYLSLEPAYAYQRPPWWDLTSLIGFFGPSPTTGDSIQFGPLPPFGISYSRGGNTEAPGAVIDAGVPVAKTLNAAAAASQQSVTGAVFHPASYTVTGSMQFGAISVASGGQTNPDGSTTVDNSAQVTLAGTFIAAGVEGSRQGTFSVSQGKALISPGGRLTVNGYGVVGFASAAPASGVTAAGLTVLGQATFNGASFAQAGTIGLFITDSNKGTATGNVGQGGSLNTTGLVIGAGPGFGFGAGTGAFTIVAGGTLTDAAPGAGIMVGVGIGATGTITDSGQINSGTVTIGGAGGNGTGVATITASGTWANSGTFTVASGMATQTGGVNTVSQGGTLSDQGVLKTGALTIGGSATVDAGTITLTAPNGGTPTGVLGVGQSGTLAVSGGGSITAPLLQIANGGSATFNGATVNNTGMGTPAAGAGLMLDGQIDLNSSKVTETAANAAIVIGYVDTTSPSPYAGTVTAKGATVATNSTTLASGSGGAQVSGGLAIMGGTWTDSGAGTSMVIGAGGVGHLTVSGNATLTDQGVAVGTSAPGTAGQAASTASVDAGATWNVGTDMAVGGLGTGAVSISGKLTVSGALSVTAPTNASSSLLVSGTLSVGKNLTLGNGGGSASLKVSTTGTLTDNQGTITLNSGNVDLSGTTAVASALVEDPSGPMTNIVTVESGATLSLTGAAGATIEYGSTLALAGGTLQTGTVSAAAGGWIAGVGAITGPGGSSATVNLNGGTLSAGTASGGGNLTITGSVSGGEIVINPNAVLEITGAAGAAGTMTDVTFAHGGKTGGDTLDIDQPTNLIDQLTTLVGIGTGDKIYVGAAVNEAVIQGVDLKLYDSNNLVLVFELANAALYNQNDFKFSASGNGTTITYNGSVTGSSAGLSTGPVTSPGIPTIGNPLGLTVAAISDPNALSVTADVSDNNGVLGASAAGGATVTSSGSTLSITGSVSDVNATLASLTYTGMTPGADTVSLSVSDDQGSFDARSSAVTVADPGVTETVPGARSVTAGTAAALPGVSIADVLTDPSLSYTVTISDTSGTLDAREEGAATVSGAGSTTLTVSGDLLSVDRSLATLSYTGAAPGSDVVSVTAADQFGFSTTQTIAVSIAQPTVPTETDWASGVDGDAGDAANWTGGVPTAALNTVITQGDYTVTGTISAAQLLIQGGATFTGMVNAAGTPGDYRTTMIDNGGATFDGGTLVTPTIVIGPAFDSGGGLSLVNGAVATLSGMGPNGQALGFYLGRAQDSEGGVSVSDSTLSSAEGFSVGYDGTGALSIEDGGTVTTTDPNTSDGYAGVSAGYDTTAAGAISVDGAGSTLTTAGFLYVGLGGEGALTITNGGHVTSAGPVGTASGALGFDATGSGEASVSGAGSLWDVTQSLGVGYGGTGDLSITNGGAVEVDGPYFRIGRNTGSTGSVELSDPGSAIDAPNAALYVGLDGTASLLITNDASATFGSGVIAANSDATNTFIEIDPGSALNVLGTLADGASPNTTIEVYGSIGTGSGFDVGNGVSDRVSVQGGAISGGIGLGAGATMMVDQSASLGGAITFTGGALTYQSDVGSTPALTLDNPIVLSAASGTFNAAEALNLTGDVTFASINTARLVLNDQVNFTGTVEGFAAGDVLDLRNGNFAVFDLTSAQWSNGVLSLYDVGDALDGTVNLAGNYASDTFTVTPDGNRGFDVSFAVATTDPGPMASDGSVTVGHGRATDLTSLIDSLVSPGQSGETDTIFAVTTPQFGGQATLGGGDTVSYETNVNDTLSYSVIDQFGQIASGQIAVTVDPGPTAGSTSDTVSAGQTLDLTSLINGLVLPGLPGDTETITGVTASVGSATLGNGGDVTYVAPASGSDTVNYTVADQYNDTRTGQIAFTVTCYARGTRIATPSGEVPIETLAPGDVVCTHFSGPAPIRWVGYRRIDCTRHPDPCLVWPVRVRAHAFGKGMPHRDLWLSPDHAVFIDGVLIPVKYLIDGTSVARVAVDEVSYHHIELARHDVLLAEGLAAESYLDTGDRAAFTNGGGVRPSHPASAVLMWEASGCAPIVVGGPVLTAARRRLAARRAIGPSRAAGSRAHRDHAGMNAAGLPVVRSAGDAQFARLDL